MSYFSYFGTVWHQLPDGTNIIVNDITKFATFAEKYKDNHGFFLDHTVGDGERAEQISDRLYDTSRFWWTIYLFNGIYDIDNQWPKSTEQLDLYIQKLYPGQDQNDILHYKTQDGLITDTKALWIASGRKTAIENIPVAFNLTPVTIGEYEIGLNDAKRKIKLIDPDMINVVENDLKEAFSE